MTRPRRIGLALERESVFARQVLQGMAAAVPELERSGFPVDLRFLPDRLVRDAADLRGFDGFVVSDYTGILEMINHGYATDLSDAARLSMNAGLDMDMMSAAYMNHLKQLIELLIALVLLTRDDDGLSVRLFSRFRRI